MGKKEIYVSGQGGKKKKGEGLEDLGMTRYTHTHEVSSLELGRRRESLTEKDCFLYV